MSKRPAWTKEELAEFEELIDDLSSAEQMRRINGRVYMPKFVERHGKEKCEAMFAHLEGKRKS